MAAWGLLKVDESEFMEITGDSPEAAAKSVGGVACKLREGNPPTFLVAARGSFYFMKKKSE